MAEYIKVNDALRVYVVIVTLFGGMYVRETYRTRKLRAALAAEKQAHHELASKRFDQTVRANLIVQTNTRFVQYLNTHRHYLPPESFNALVEDHKADVEYMKLVNELTKT